MKCKRCGFEVSDSATTCEVCGGNPLSTEDDPDYSSAKQEKNPNVVMGVAATRTISLSDITGTHTPSFPISNDYGITAPSESSSGTDNSSSKARDKEGTPVTSGQESTAAQPRHSTSYTRNATSLTDETRSFYTSSYVVTLPPSAGADEGLPTRSSNATLNSPRDLSTPSITPADVEAIAPLYSQAKTIETTLTPSPEKQSAVVSSPLSGKLVAVLALLAIIALAVALVGGFLSSSDSNNSSKTAESSAHQDEADKTQSLQNRLVGKWTLSSIETDGERSTVANTIYGAMSIRIKADGSFRWTDGSNTISGTWLPSDDGSFFELTSDTKHFTEFGEWPYRGTLAKKKMLVTLGESSYDALVFEKAK